TFAKTREALELLDQNLLRHPSSAEDERAKATVLGTQPQHRREAIALLERYIQTQAPNPQEQLLLANLYEQEGDWSKARSTLLSPAPARGNNAFYLACLVQSLLGHKGRPTAEFWLKNLQKIERDSIRTVTLKANLMAAQGHLEGAVKLAE